MNDTEKRPKAKMLRNAFGMLKRKSSNNDLGYNYLEDDDATNDDDGALGIEPCAMLGRSDYKEAFGFDDSSLDSEYSDYSYSDGDDERTIVSSNSASPNKRASPKRKNAPRQLEAIQLVIQEPSGHLQPQPRFRSFDEHVPLPNTRERHSLGLRRDSSSPASSPASTFSVVASYFPQSRKSRVSDRLEPPGTPTATETDSDTSCTVDTEDDSFDAVHTLPKLKRTIRFADEDGLPIHTVHYTEPDQEEVDPDWNTIIVLLLSPKKRKFEFLHLTYNVTERTPMSHVLKQLPTMASDVSLTRQTYVGMCRQDGQELINSLALQDANLEKDEILVAILAGMQSKVIARLSEPLLADKTVQKMVRRKIRNGFAVQRVLRSPDETNAGEESSDKLPETIQLPSTPRLCPSSLPSDETGIESGMQEDTKPMATSVPTKPPGDSQVESEEIQQVASSLSSLEVYGSDSTMSTTEDDMHSAEPQLTAASHEHELDVETRPIEAAAKPDEPQIAAATPATAPESDSPSDESDTDSDGLGFEEDNSSGTSDSEEDKLVASALNTNSVNFSDTDSSEEEGLIAPPQLPRQTDQQLSLFEAIDDISATVEELLAADQASKSQTAEEFGVPYGTPDASDESDDTDESVPFDEELAMEVPRIEGVPDMLSCAHNHSNESFDSERIIRTPLLVDADVRHIAAGSWMSSSSQDSDSSADRLRIEVDGLEDLRNLKDEEEKNKSPQSESSAIIMQILIGLLLKLFSSGKPRKKKRGLARKISKKKLKKAQTEV